MGIWPTIPITFTSWNVSGRRCDDDNAIAVLEHPNRVSRIHLFGDEWGKAAALMQKPLLLLTHLSISSSKLKAPTLPDGFLGGSAPSLQEFHLRNVLYPALPILLLSACNLVDLRLHDILPTGYISPEAMVLHVSASSKLETLHIKFNDLTSFSDLMISPPLTRTVLPALRIFLFTGKCKYLEDFVSRIDTPQLNYIVVRYQSGDINLNFDVPHLSNFVNRSESFKQTLSRHCKITVNQVFLDVATFCLGRTTSERRDPKPGISICLGRGIEGKLSHLTNILGFMPPILSDVVHCTIDSDYPLAASSYDQEGRDAFHWLQLLRQLSSLQTLFAFGNTARLISQALAYVGYVGTITEILPALQLLYLEDEVDEVDDDQATSSVHRFLAARRHSGHPVTLVTTKDEFEEKLKSHP